MPLHPERLKERGFNQAMEIARTLSGKTGIPLAEDLVQRIRPTQPQAGLNLLGRRRNMRGAFSCPLNFKGKRIALIDDVMTTGTSLNELARCLKVAGAANVECWVVARTTRHAFRG